MKLVVTAAAVILLQAPQSESVDALAIRVAGTGRSAERTQRLATWINTEFHWTATDYQTRTADEVIARRGGNCAELAKVLARLLDAAQIRYRRVREINLHPESTRRQENAEALVKQRGYSATVFGRRHNDHVWLEIEDPLEGWVPADPSVGTVGTKEWVAARLALAGRTKPAVPAVAQIVKDMIAPLAVVSADAPREDRSAHYLIDGFDQAYGGRLALLPAWKDWTRQVRAFAPLARGAFEGKVNLHEHAAAIDALAGTYSRLQQEGDGLRPQAVR